MNDVKPGFKTTEFWATLGVQVVGVLMLVGVLTPDQGALLEVDLSQAAVIVTRVITDVTALGAMVITVYRYITGRSIVKKAAAGK